MTNKSLVAVALMMLMTAGSGCTMFTKEKGSKKSPWDSLPWRKKEYQTPTKMAVLWSPDLLTVAGQPPTRGFGGRIYFYNDKSQTIPVDGELVVHGFDETVKKAASGQDTVPDKRFRFTAEQFTEHFSQSDLGASYSVWIPWDCNEHTLKELTLIPTFVSSKGQAIQGAPAKVILPGRNAAQPDLSAPIQTVAFEQSSIPTVEGKLPILNSPNRESDKLRGNITASANATASATTNSNSESGDMRVTTIKLPAPIGQNRGRQTNGNSNAQPATPMLNNLSPVQPYVNAQLEQMRAQAVADAFRPLDQQGMPVQAMPQGQPGVPGISRPQGMQGQSYPQPQAGAYQNQGGQASMLNPSWPLANNMNGDPTQQVQPVNHAPKSFKTLPNSLNSAAPYRGDDYPGELPPGFQFSPQGTAW